MNEYKKFSYYYDEVMQSLEYDLWADFIKPYINKDSKLLDIACGTGSFLMLNYGIVKECYGLDLSETAIEIAKEKAKINHFNINYDVFDMTNFSYDIKFDVITCFFDSINFLNSIDKVNLCFKQVLNALKPGGYFIFDIFTKTLFNEYKNNKFKADYTTFKINWQTKKIDNKTLKHDIKINEDDQIYYETYNEYYYDFKDFDLTGFNLINICGDFNVDFRDSDERMLIILKKAL